MSSSNFQLLVLSDQKKHFDAAMALAFDDCPGGKAEAYCNLDSKTGFVLYWCAKAATPQREEISILPYAMGVEDAINFVWGWLKSIKYEDYDKEPHDGDVVYKKGFKIYKISDGPYAFVAIKPVYTEYHK